MKKMDNYEAFEKRERITFLISIVAVIISAISFFLTLYEQLSDNNLELQQYTVFDENGRDSSITLFLKNTGTEPAEDVEISFDFERFYLKSRDRRFLMNNYLTNNEFYILYANTSVINKSWDALYEELIKDAKINIPALFPGEVFVMKLKLRPYDRNEIFNPFIHYIKHADGYVSYNPVNEQLNRDSIVKSLFTYENLLEPQIREFLVVESNRYKNNSFVINECKTFFEEYKVEDFGFYTDIFMILSEVGGINETIYMLDKIIAAQSEYELFQLSKAFPFMVMENSFHSKLIDIFIVKCKQLLKNDRIGVDTRKMMVSKLLSAFLKQEQISPKTQTAILDHIIEYLDNDKDYTGDPYFIQDVLSGFLKYNEDEAENERVLNKIIDVYKKSMDDSYKKYYFLQFFVDLKAQSACPAIISSIKTADNRNAWKINKALEKITGYENRAFDDFRYDSLEVEEVYREDIIAEWNSYLEEVSSP